MTRTASLSAVALLALTACQGPDPHPLSWDATVAMPYEPLVMCLARNVPPDYQMTPAIDRRQNLGGVLITQRGSGRKIGEFDVYRIDDNTSHLVFRSGNNTVGGSSYYESQARGMASACGAP
jgi:hypothetical protein